MKHKLLLLLLVSFLGLTAQNKKSSFYKPVPQKFIPVNDYAALLTAQQNKSLSKTLQHYKDSTGNVVVIITQKSLKDAATNETYTIEEVAWHYFNKWGIGDKEKNNGVLIFVAKDDRKVRIATGKGITNLLTDSDCQYIIDNDIIPNFKMQDYATGLNDAVQSVFAELSTTTNKIVTGSSNSSNNTSSLPAELPENNSSTSIKSTIWGICFIVFFILILGLRRPRNGNTYLTGNNGGGPTDYYPQRRSWWGSSPSYGNNYYIDNRRSNYGSSGSSYRSSGSSYNNSSSYDSGSSSSSGSDSSSGGSSYGGGSSGGGGASGSW